ncbi:class I SAM-dependent methyltransferase [candidate division KSB1 bacterium]|nr:class I SAM-dependent methyltransferase [candidate division KSB1 bacterium]
MDKRNALKEDCRRIWETNADCWDQISDRVGWHELLIVPATERLLGAKEGERILDIACGNGNFSRRLASMGADVVAFDFCSNLIEKARSRTLENIERIDYRVMDATDTQAMLSLGDSCFDAAVCCMGLFDIMEISPLASALPGLLKPAGRFVFSIMHPCFNSGNFKKVTEITEINGKIETEYAIKRSTYIRNLTHKGLALAHQPEPQYYFHRSIHEIFKPFFKAGFIIDGLEEPVFDSADTTNSLSRQLYKEIPPVMVIRARC